MAGRRLRAGGAAPAQLPPAAPLSWGRGRLLALLTATGAVAVGVLAGLVVAVLSAWAPAQPTTFAPTASAALGGGRSVADQRDALAAAPMPSAAADDALPGPLSARAPGVIELPRPTAVGPGGVPTAFPRTPAGALAQLAAIDVTAMQSASLDGVRRVIDAWAATGGPSRASWSGVGSMARLLSAAGLSGVGSTQLAVVVRPAMGLIKGTAGPEFAVVCVDFEVTVTLTRTARIAVADCQRMAWAGGRWLIGPGPEPAPGPSVWPGTERAAAVGYRELRYA